MIANGTYRARAVAAELSVAQTGSEFVAVAFELVDYPEVRQTVPWRGFFTEKTQAQTLQALECCGWEGDFTDLRSVLRHDVEIVVEQETDPRGGTRARVRWVNAVGRGAPMRRMSAEEVHAFASRFERNGWNAATAPPAVAEDETAQAASPADTSDPF